MFVDGALAEAIDGDEDVGKQIPRDAVADDLHADLLRRCESPGNAARIVALCCCSQSSWDRKTPRTRSMAQQSSGEFASADPTNGEEDARVQERGIRAKISLSACSSL